MIVYRLLIVLPQITLLYADEFGNYYETPPEGSEVQDSPPLTQAIDDVRTYRNQLLSGSDWTQIADSPLSDAQRLAWRVYRQQLRDYPSLINYELWTAPEWPIAPW
jgi:Phage tail assembly chaperone protein